MVCGKIRIVVKLHNCNMTYGAELLAAAAKKAMHAMRRHSTFLGLSDPLSICKLFDMQLVKCISCMYHHAVKFTDNVLKFNANKSVSECNSVLSAEKNKWW